MTEYTVTFTDATPPLDLVIDEVAPSGPVMLFFNSGIVVRQINSDLVDTVLATDLPPTGTYTYTVVRASGPDIVILSDSDTGLNSYTDTHAMVRVSETVVGAMLRWADVRSIERTLTEV